MIELRNVTRRYQQGEIEVLALDRINLGFEKNEFVAIRGESGSGKSTLLHLLGALDKPDAGEISIDGVQLHKASEQEMTRYRARDLGIIFQFFNLLPTLTVLENVTLPLQLQKVRGQEADKRARAMLRLVALEHRAGHFAHQLSGGEMQRTAIARALVHHPKLVLADEPTGNLDGANAERVLEILTRIWSEQLTTLIVVTHSAEVADLAQRQIYLKNGTVLSDSGRPIAVG